MADDSVIAEAEEAFDAIARRWIDDATEPRASDIPDLVYHYTNAAGLHGILNSHEIWLTDYRFLNDRTEMLTGQNLIREITSDARRLKEMPVAFSTYLQGFNATGPINIAHVFSLSRLGDDLSQWRGYADDGMGFTVGFDGQLLMKMCERAHFCAVNYDMDLQRKALNLALKEMRTELTKRVDLHKRMCDELASEAARSFSWLSRNRSQAEKHHSFRAEDEWRIIEWCAPEATRDVRLSGNRLVPYLKMQNGRGAKLPINRIGVGPGHQGPEVKSAVLTLAKKCGYDVEVYSADSPFRRV